MPHSTPPRQGALTGILGKASWLVPMVFAVGFTVWYVASVLMRQDTTTLQIVMVLVITPILFGAGYLIGVGFLAWVMLSAAGAFAVLEGADSPLKRLVYWPLAGIVFVFLLFWFG